VAAHARDLDDVTPPRAFEGGTNLLNRHIRFARNAEVWPVEQDVRPIHGLPCGVEIDPEVWPPRASGPSQPAGGKHPSAVGEGHSLFRVLADHATIVPTV
jgi:hypothetical protein